MCGTHVGHEGRVQQAGLEARPVETREEAVLLDLRGAAPARRRPEPRARALGEQRAAQRARALAELRRVLLLLVLPIVRKITRLGLTTPLATVNDEVIIITIYFFITIIVI